MNRGGRRWSMAAVCAAATAGGALLAVAAAALAAGGAGAPTGSVLLALLAGAAGALLVGAAAARWSATLSRVLRTLARSDAPVLRPPALLGAEVSALHRAVQALRLRARVADELAEAGRRSASTASAGMFELLSGLIAAEEGARGQLAAELHDTVAQTLMLARSGLAASASPEEAERAAELVGEAEEQVRALMARTRPPALRDGDLAGAMAALCEELSQRYGLEVRVSWPAQPRPLPVATAITVYRFFQEALLNVVKHADVDCAHAELEVVGEELVALVRDEGPGFDPGEVRSERGRHVGLGLLRERARLAGGSVQVQSWPADGTTVSLHLPIGAPAAASAPGWRSALAAPAPRQQEHARG